jgi:hypothetical protein
MRKRNSFVLLALLAALADAGAQTATPTLGTDRNGHNLHATALHGQEPGRGGSLNFNPSLVFDGVDDYLRITCSTKQTSDTICPGSPQADGPSPG